MPPDVQNSRKPPCCSPPCSASREFRWRVPLTTGSRPRAAVFLQTLSPQGLYECACVCTSVRACVRVCIRMLGAVLMHLAGRGRTAECPAVCERHCLMQLRTVLLTNATASSWGSRIRETHRPACRSLRGYWNVKVHRARQALEELPAQQWPWEETRARAHTHTRTRGERVTSARRVSRGLLGRLRDENPTAQPGRSSMPSEHLPRAGCTPGTLLGPRSQCSLSGAPDLEKDSDEQTRAEGGAVSTGSVYTGGNPPCLQGPGRCWSQDPRSRRYIATLG